MKSARLQRRPQTNRPGFAVLLMLLIIVVICTLIWLDPSALFSRSDPELPWNQKFRILKSDQEPQTPSKKQPDVTRGILFEADAKQQDEPRGKIRLVIQPNGKVKGSWVAEYNPSPKLNYLVMGASFKGNIDPSKVYSDENGEDPSKLYFITKGRFIILETRLESNRVRSVKGRIYVTGWVDPGYNATGEIIITSDKRSFQAFDWKARHPVRKSQYPW